MRLLFAIIALLSGCPADPETPAEVASDIDVSEDVPFDDGGVDAPDADADEPPPCPSFGPVEVAGSVPNLVLGEISGLAASRRHADTWWVHNDSGDAARVYAISPSGATIAAYDLQGVVHEDYEDMALAPDPAGDLLLVGDIGDNDRKRAQVHVYLVPEPDAVTAGQHTITGIERLDLVYPDEPHDSEALVHDPRSGDVWLVTKEWDGASRLFRVPQPWTPGEAATLEDGGTVSFFDPDDGLAQLVTGADVTADGTLAVVRTYATAFVWRLGAAESFADALLAGERCPIPLADEPQGEAIAFTPAGDAYVTISERKGDPPFVYRFPRTGP